MKKTALVLLNIALMTNLNAQSYKKSYPETKKVNHVDKYFDVAVKDDYRWLEDDLSESTKNG